MKNGKKGDFKPRLLLDKGSNFWIRIQYNKIYSEPITGLKVIECNLDKDGNLVRINNNISSY
jgi:hypothetical protein